MAMAQRRTSHFVLLAFLAALFLLTTGQSAQAAAAPKCADLVVNGMAAVPVAVQGIPATVYVSVSNTGSCAAGAFSCAVEAGALRSDPGDCACTGSARGRNRECPRPIHVPDRNGVPRLCHGRLWTHRRRDERVEQLRDDVPAGHRGETRSRGHGRDDESEPALREQPGDGDDHGEERRRRGGRRLPGAMAPVGSGGPPDRDGHEFCAGGLGERRTRIDLPHRGSLRRDGAGWTARARSRNSTSSTTSSTAVDTITPTLNVQRIAQNGFGDSRNTFSWSMAWFDGKLYVGTQRSSYCFEQMTLAFTTRTRVITTASRTRCRRRTVRPTGTDLWISGPRSGSTRREPECGSGSTSLRPSRTRELQARTWPGTSAIEAWSSIKAPSTSEASPPVRRYPSWHRSRRGFSGPRTGRRGAPSRPAPARSTRPPTRSTRAGSDRVPGDGGLQGPALRHGERRADG